jgi:hypothetical protein
MDEFAGRIDIVHLLRWFDRYPVSVEIKGSTVPLLATKFWITSNIDPAEWYSNKPEVSQEQINALFRRFTLVEEFQ